MTNKVITGRYRLFNIDADSGAHFFIKDFDTEYEGESWAERNLRGFWVLKDSTKQ